MTLRWNDVAASRAHAHVSQGFYVFCYHKCHSKRWKCPMFCWKCPLFYWKCPMFCWKRAVVLCKMSCRFMENKPSFGLCRWIKCGYLLKMAVSSLFSVCWQWRCDTCDSKKTKLQCVCVRAHARETKFWSLNNMFHCICFVFWEGLSLMPVCAKERLGLFVFVERGLLLTRGDLQELFSECLQGHRRGATLGKEPVFDAVFES